MSLGLSAIAELLVYQKSLSIIPTNVNGMLTNLSNVKMKYVVVKFSKYKTRRKRHVLVNFEKTDEARSRSIFHFNDDTNVEFGFVIQQWRVLAPRVRWMSSVDNSLIFLTLLICQWTTVTITHSSVTSSILARIVQMLQIWGQNKIQAFRVTRPSR